MFTIDLLKGQGIPVKTTPQGMAVAAAATLVPAVTAIMLFGFYLYDRVIVSVQQQRVASYEEKIAELDDVVEQREHLESQISHQKGCLTEVGSLVQRHHQWSPVLAMLVRSMPESLVLTNLEVKERTVRKLVPDEDDPEIEIEVSVPAKTLAMTVRNAVGTEADSDAVRKFREQLYSDEALNPLLENVVVSQRTQRIHGQTVMTYEISCLFKSKV